MFKQGRAFLALALVATLLLGLQAPAHAKTTESDTGLAVVNTVKSGHQFVASTELAATASVTVVPGDTLSGLASRHCGNSAWSGIYKDNLSVVGGDPNLIYPGQRLVINCATGTVSTPQTQAATPVRASSGWTSPGSGLCFPGGDSGFRTYARPSHNGADLPGGRYGGQAIHAVAAGTVSVNWQAGGAGNYTMINHGGGIWSVYMHQSSFAVRSGYVGAGTVIGYVGTTGNSFGPHLHLEIHTGGAWNGQVDPVSFLAARGVNIRC